MLYQEKSMIDVMFFLMILKILNALIIFELIGKFNLIKYKLIKELMIICIFSLPLENPKFHQKKLDYVEWEKQDQNMKNLQDLIAENSHSKEKNMILKMDIKL